MPVPRCMAVTPAVFCRMALELPEVVEQASPGRREFQIDGQTFAVLTKHRKVWALLRLRPEEGSVMVRSEPRLYRQAPGPGTVEGDTQVRLDAVSTANLEPMLHLAWGAQAGPAMRDRHRGRVVLRSNL